MDIKKVGVVGGGTMGHGIAQVVVQSGREAIIVEVSEEKGREAIARIKSSIDRFVKKERISAADAEAALARITPTTDLSAVAGSIPSR